MLNALTKQNAPVNFVVHEIPMEYVCIAETLLQHTKNIVLISTAEHLRQRTHCPKEN